MFSRDVAVLLHYDIHNLLRYDDYLHNLLVADVFLALLVLEHCSLDGVVGGVGRELLLEACLSVEGNRKLHLTLHEILLVESGPCGVTDSGGVTECVPQFLCDVRSERSDEHNKLLEHFL